MLNEVKLIGRLGKDPEMRRTQSGQQVANFSIATSEKWKDRTTGEPKEATHWHNVVCWNENLCKVIEQYVKKGSLLYVCGKLQTRKWQDQQGQDRYSTEVVLNGYEAKIVMLDRKEGNGGSREQPPPDEREASKPAPSGGYSKTLDDEIPF